MKLTPKPPAPAPANKLGAAERRKKRDPRKDDFNRAMLACKISLEAAEKMPDGPAKLAAQNAAIALLSKDAPKRPDRRKGRVSQESRPIDFWG